MSRYGYDKDTLVLNTERFTIKEGYIVGGGGFLILTITMGEYYYKILGKPLRGKSSIEILLHKIQENHEMDFNTLIWYTVLYMYIQLKSIKNYWSTNNIK